MGRESRKRPIEVVDGKRSPDNQNGTASFSRHTHKNDHNARNERFHPGMGKSQAVLGAREQYITT